MEMERIVWAVFELIANRSSMAPCLPLPPIGWSGRPTLV